MQPDTQTFTATHTGLTQSPMNNENGEESSDLLARVNGVSQELDNAINGQLRANSNSAASNIIFLNHIALNHLKNIC